MSGICNAVTGVCDAPDVCGNSVVETGEACDDGNNLPGDGCNAACLIEDNNGTCSSDSDCASNNCNPATGMCEINVNCGNGTLEVADGEACDDTNTMGGDGCSETCLQEDDYMAPCAADGDCVTGTCDVCLLYTSPSPRDATLSRMPSSA